MTRPTLPTVLDWLPGRDAVGRAYALYDHEYHEYDAEVLGTVVACWPECGPTWAVRLHEPDPDHRPVTVFHYERPESKHGRWLVTRAVGMKKADRYAALVAARQGSAPCPASRAGFVAPSGRWP